jgi:hypothetical protein
LNTLIYSIQRQVNATKVVHLINSNFKITKVLINA